MEAFLHGPIPTMQSTIIMVSQVLQDLFVPLPASLKQKKRRPLWAAVRHSEAEFASRSSRGPAAVDVRFSCMSMRWHVAKGFLDSPSSLAVDDDDDDEYGDKDDNGDDVMMIALA